jgi:hypothetical protein
MATPDATDFPVTIQLTQGYSTVIDAEDKDLARHRWRAISRSRSCYLPVAGRHGGHGVLALLHREVLGRAIGRPLLPTEMVDHIDGNPLNNRRSNLRLATHADNMKNRRKHSNNKSGFKGVRQRKNRPGWVAEIRVDGKYTHLGTFDTPELAHEAYCKAAEKHHGEFANFG